jgi:hypothetical protein
MIKRMQSMGMYTMIEAVVRVYILVQKGGKSGAGDV